MKFTAIRENHLFVKAYQGGKRASAPTLTLYVLRDRQGYRYMKARPDKRYVNRIGITSSKKIGGAVQRNRARRVIREALRLIMQDRPLVTGNLVVIAARTGAVTASMPQVKADLEKCLDRLGMYYDPAAAAAKRAAAQERREP